MRKHFWWMALVGLALVSCAPSARTNVYTNPAYEQGSVASIAVLPIRNTRLAPSEAQFVNREVTQGIQAQSSPDLRIITSTQASDALNASGLVEAYSDFVRDFAASGIPNTDTLRQLGNALGVDAIFQGELIDVFQENGLFGVRSASTRVTMRLVMLDTTTGDILWEGSAQGFAQGSTLSAAPPVFDALEPALNGLISQLPAL